MIHDADDFLRWLRKAYKKDRTMYHVGYLACDRGSETPRLRNDTQQRYSVLADTVYREYLRGAVALAQRKVGKSTYQYHAIKR
jgi:hypothetical protein